MYRGLKVLERVITVGLFFNLLLIGQAKGQSGEVDISADEFSDPVEPEGPEKPEVAADQPSSDEDVWSEEAVAGEEDIQPEDGEASEVDEPSEDLSEQTDEADEALEEEQEQEEEEENMVAAEALAEEEYQRPRGQVALELGSYLKAIKTDSIVELAPILSGWIGISENIDLFLDIGAAFASFDSPGVDTLTTLFLGNPYLGIRKSFRADRTHFNFGFGLTIPLPLMDVPQQPQESEPDYQRKMSLYRSEMRDYKAIIATYQIASAMRGRWNHWLWMPEHVGLVIPISAKMVSENNILFGGELGLAVLIPAGDYHDHRGDFLAQGAGELGFSFGSIETGLRVQAVMIPLLANAPLIDGEKVINDDKFQASVGPFITYNFSRGYLKANLTFNLDQIEGFFDGNNRWGLNLSGGMSF